LCLLDVKATMVEVQGPFVSNGILRETFPQGFPKEETLGDDLRRLRLAYEAWQDSPAFDLAAHQEWLRFVLTEVLEFEDVLLATGQAIPQSLRVHLAEARAEVAPDLVVTTAPEEDLLGNPSAPQALIPVFFAARGQKLEKPLSSESARTNNREAGDAFNTAGWTDPSARGSSFTQDHAHEANPQTPVLGVLGGIGAAVPDRVVTVQILLRVANAERQIV
jgi:hypothetical protein